MKQNKIYNFRYYENFFVIILFLVYFLIGSQIFADYSFYIDEKYYKKYAIPSNFKKFKELKIDNTIIFDVYKRLD